MSGMLEFRALGPFEVLRGNDPIELGSHKQRMLLALLLINANRVVSRDRITEALWGEDASDKENALWVYVSRLRTVLEPERTGRGESTLLITKEPGYMLSAALSASTTSGSSRALTRANLIETDADSALAALDEAMHLWQGDALADFAYETFARAEIDRLDELRLEALELRFDARLQLGHAAELISGLEILSRQNPYRERPVAQLITSLYPTGRQTEALRTFERHRHALSEELGIDPSPELCRLKEQILLHDEHLVHTSRRAGPPPEQPIPTRASTLSRKPTAGIASDGRGCSPKCFAGSIEAMGCRGPRQAKRYPASQTLVSARLIPAISETAVAGTCGMAHRTDGPGRPSVRRTRGRTASRTRIDGPNGLAAQLGNEDRGHPPSGTPRPYPVTTPTCSSLFDQLERSCPHPRR